jgi:hypothetical protein
MNLHPLLFTFHARRRAAWRVLLVPLVLLALALFLIRAARLPWMSVLAVVAALLGLMLWFAIAHGLVQQNRARHAQLVPGQAQKLRRCWLGNAALLGGLATALLSASVPALSAVEWAFGMGAFMLLMGGLMAAPSGSPWMNSVWSVSVMALVIQQDRWGPSVRTLLDGLGPWAWGLPLLALAAQWPMLARGGPAHVRRDAVRELAKRLQQQAGRGDWTSLSAGKASPGRLSAIVLGRPPRSAPPLRRVAWLLLRPLTPLQAGLRSVGFTGVLVVLGALGSALMGLAPRRASEAGLAVTLLALLPLLPWALGWWSDRLRASRRDQALLLLLPGVPRGPALARAWPREALRVAVLGGLATLAPAVLLTLLLAPGQWMALVGVAMLASPTLIAALRHPAWARAYVPLLFVALLPVWVLWAPLFWLMAVTALAIALGFGLLLLLQRPAAEPFPAGRYVDRQSGNSVK